MPNKLINNTLNKILYKGKYTKKDVYSHNKGERICDRCGAHIGLKGYYNKANDLDMCTSCMDACSFDINGTKEWKKR